jgi:hypothetical protein
MRAAFFLLLSFPLFGWNPQEDVNVNSRYTVEKVDVSGKLGPRISHELRQELDSIVGQKLDHSVLERLSARIRHDLRVQNVAVRVRRGEVPDHVTVEFEVQSGRRKDFDIDVPKFAYNSRQGWSGIAEATTTIGNTAMTFGVASDGDELVERFSGIRARAERQSVGTKRLRFRFEFDGYHAQWNQSTFSALSQQPLEPGIYRSRENFEPTATVVLAKPLTWTLGVSFQQMQMQVPSAPAQSANSIENTLRFHQDWEDIDSSRQVLDAAYTLRAATKILDSDFVYVRHSAKVRYEVRRGHNELTLDFAVGGLNGRAPLFERFVLGNASTLRGWNKFDLDPLGGDRAVHGSIDYRYRFVTVFYDTGVLWNGNGCTGEKHGAGIGFRSEGKEGILLAVAFPLRSGHVDPVFIAGFNF